MVMKLYHSSNEKLQKLKPKNGYNRNKGEDLGAIDKKVIYLTNDSQQIRRDEKGNADKYRYTVEVDSNDPDLHEDKKFTNLIECGNQALKKAVNIRWYYLFHEVDIIETEIWDGKGYKKI